MHGCPFTTQPLKGPVSFIKRSGKSAAEDRGEAGYEGIRCGSSRAKKKADTFLKKSIQKTFDSRTRVG
jgi:hypothetical protein